MEWIIRDLPQPLFAIGIFLILCVAALAGNRARRFRTAKHELGSTQEGYVVSAVLGLLALLIGFTFSMAVDRHDTRRALVTEEANAIASTYSLAQTFGEPHRQGISSLLLDYATVRLALGQSSDKVEGGKLLARSEQLQDRISTAGLAAVATIRDDVSASFLSGAVGMFEAGEMRIVARRSHIPTHVYTILFVYMAISAAVLGFAFAGSPQIVTNGTLFILLTISMLLIVDLDRPTTGFIVESQSAIEVMKSRMDRHHAARLRDAAAAAGETPSGNGTARTSS